MEGSMTSITRKMFGKAVSGQLTVSEAVAFLEREANVRTLREKLEKFSQGCDLETVLVEGLTRHHPDMSRDFVKKRVHGWLNDPVQQTLGKKDALEICFILGLSVEKAESFVALVTEEGLHWRNPDEIVYIFALKQGMDYLEAALLNEEMQEILVSARESENLAENSFTPVIRSEVSALGTREELAEYLIDAASRLGRYHNTAYKLFLDMMNVLENPELDEAEKRAELFGQEKLTIHDIIREYLYENVSHARAMAHARRKDVLHAGDTKLIFDVIQDKVSSCWPDETTLSKMKSREMDVTRKVLILLFLATDQGLVAEDEEDFETGFSRDEIFGDLYQRLNDMLMQCGFMVLDPRSLFDWLVLYCICVDDVFDVDIRMRAVLKEMFGER